MLQRPRFKPQYRAEVVPGEGLFLLSEAHQTILQGQLYERIAPLLDGRSIEDICRSLAPDLQPAKVFYTLKKLEDAGHLCESDDIPPSQAASWAMQGIEPSVGRDRLKQATVRVTALGLDAGPLLGLLGSLGVQVVEESDATLHLVVADQPLRDEMVAINREALKTGRPWMLVKPVGCLVWLGPIFRPGHTGCWQCLARRIRANYPVLGLLDNIRAQEGQSLPMTDLAYTPATLSVAWGLAAQTVADWIAHEGKLPHLDNKLMTFDVVGWRVQSHTLLRQSTCEMCGDAADGMGSEAPQLVLQSRKKTYCEDGGHRVNSPQETIDRYVHHVSHICGAVSMLERAESSDGVMHVYHSGANIARGPESVLNLKSDLRNSSAGKGTTDLQARASALCEALERYSGLFRGDEPRRRTRFVDLKGAIHPNDCMLFSERQYAERKELNARPAIFTAIPAPFDPEAEMSWSPLWSLTSQTTRYLPTSFCYFDAQECHGCNGGTHHHREPFCLGDSNGNAAGNSIEEAILQGFFELVERDGVALWWYNRARVRGVDLDSFNDPYLPRLRTWLASQGRDLWVLDLTTDLGIPVFAACSRRVDAPAEHIMFGFGSHMDPKIALLRAVTELNQMLSLLIDAPPDGPPSKINDEETVNWLMKARVAEHAYLQPSDLPLSRASDYAHGWSDDVKVDVEICVERVKSLGLDFLVLDQTRPEIGMPVVKVVVPGLRHFWPRFAAGRLYDVPAKLGWLPGVLTEEQMNPTPMFL